MTMTWLQYDGWQLTKRFLFNDDQLQRIEIVPVGDEPAVDDVYTGLIVNEAKGMQAYFVDFNGYTGLMRSDHAYKIGQVLPVTVVKEPRDDKGYRISDRVYYKTRTVIHFPDDPAVHMSRKLDKARRDSLSARFGNEPGILFRTACGDATDTEIAADIAVVRRAHAEALRLTGIRQTGRRVHQHAEETERIEDLSRCLELEDLLDAHRQSERILEDRTRLTFEQTRAGLVVDFDSYRRSSREDTPFTLNRDMMDVLLNELEIRDAGGMILVDLISMNSETDRRALEKYAAERVEQRSGMRFHGITTLDVMQLTRKVMRQGLMQYDEVALLLERLHLRIRALAEHADFTGLEIRLHDRFYPDRSRFLSLGEVFRIPVSLAFDSNEADCRVRVKNEVD